MTVDLEQTIAKTLGCVDSSNTTAPQKQVDSYAYSVADNHWKELNSIRTSREVCNVIIGDVEEGNTCPMNEALNYGKCF